MTCTTTPLGRRSYVSRLRAGLLASVILGLSLTIITVTGGRAAALATPTPVQIAGAAKSPPARLLMWTPQGRLVGLGLMLGMAAFETKGKWLPVLEEWMNPDEPQSERNSARDVYTPNQRCRNMGEDVTYVAGALTATVAIRWKCEWAKYSGDLKPSMNYIQQSADCVNKLTGEVRLNQTTPGMSNPGVAAGTYVGGSTILRTMGTTTLTTPQLCPSGFLPIGFSIIPQGSGMDWLRYHGKDGLNGGWDVADYSQTTTIRCKNLATGAYNTISQTEKGQPGRVYVPSCEEQHPGTIPWDGSITGGPTGGTKPIGTVAINQTLLDQWRDCFGPSGGLLCKTEVFVDGQRCIMGTNTCVIWWDIWKADPDRVTCKFGPYAVPVTDCANLRYAYERSHNVTTTTTASPDLDPDAPPHGSPEINPNPQPQPNPQPDPNPTPAPNPNPSPNPTTGANPEATPETTPDANPDSSSCYGAAWSWNPIDWVYVPVKCALKWAFKPKTELSVRVGTIKTAFDGKFPFAFPTYIAGMGSGAGGGCPDWRAIVNAGDGVNENVVCESSFTASIVGARPFLLAGMLAAAFWPLVRGLFFASVPVIKPTPTGRD